ncbi:MAG: S-layer homology domain-containing protein [Oscillatoriaceae bacterium SKW80]|nr:S-layer homology domain-containing protein [Oscillatoriaceae bacterium SKW80]HIK29417.1 S-layer homology domain-containing protein [Oscillatoriaceae cyanobacterium M7585_C2015_266]
MRKWQIGSALFAAIGIVVSSLTPTVAKSTFYDIQGHWAQLCIEQLAQRGIFSGFQDGSFKPEQFITRGEFASIISKAFPNAPAVSSETPFFDVSPQTPIGEAIRNARQSGFLSGYPSGLFKPNELLTRVQALVALANGLKLSPTVLDINQLNQVYDDANAIPSFALNAIAAATQRGLVVNYPYPRLLNPNQPATRAEVAAFVCQAIATSGKASLVPPQYVVAPPNSGGIQTQTQTFGQIKAELTYQKQTFVFSDLRLKVNRGEEVFLDTPLPVGGGVSSILGFRLTDLDGDGEPEILIDLFPREQRCCAYSIIYRYLPALRQYSYIQHPWGTAGYNLKDFDLDGIPEFESSDRRFWMLFSSNNPENFAPLQIWQYRQGQMFDVTRQYPNLVAANADKLWQSYQSLSSNGQDVRAVLAAYLANKMLLGQGQDAWSMVQAIYEGGDRIQYLETLRSFLRSTGYFR